MLEGRHGGLVGTRTLEEENGHVCYMGMIIGLCLVFGFLCLLLQASGCCKRDSPQSLLF